MKISKERLIKMNACEDGLKRFIDQTNNTSELVDVASLVGGKNTYDDFLWLAEKTISEERIVRFACDCALLNIELIRPYTDDYDLIVKFLKDPSKNADSANAAANNAGYVAANNAVNAANAAKAAAESVNAANAAVYNVTRTIDGRNSFEMLLIKMFDEVNEMEMLSSTKEVEYVN